MAAEKDKIKVLDDLLEVTKDDPPSDYNFDKIMSLIEKSKEMKKEEKMRSQRTNDYFKQLRDKLSESTAYLNKARKDLDNIQDVKSRNFPQLNSVEDYEILMKKSDEEIEEEMKKIKTQLDILDNRVKKFHEQSKNTDEFYHKSMETLKIINSNLNTEK